MVVVKLRNPFFIVLLSVLNAFNISGEVVTIGPVLALAAVVAALVVAPVVVGAIVVSSVGRSGIPRAFVEGVVPTVVVVPTTLPLCTLRP